MIFTLINNIFLIISNFIFDPAELQRARYDIKEIEFQIDRTIRDLCPNYKDVPELDVQSMADMWQLAYYKAEEQLTCFKIFLKKIAPQVSCN